MTQKMDAVNALLDIEVSLILNCFYQFFGSTLGSYSRPDPAPAIYLNAAPDHLTGDKKYIFLISFFSSFNLFNLNSYLK
jgi:hypothetical protein